MKVGKFTITFPNHGNFRLDGGSMFGSVPKNLWSERIQPDSVNCIPLATRSLLIKDGERTILVDVGNGDKWNERSKEIFKFEHTATEQLGIAREEVTDILLTHLHFDHAGGISYYERSGELKLTYPNATVHVQDANYKNALSPNLKERASYLKENIEILRKGKLTLLNGDGEPFPGIKVHVVNGHTVGQQWIEVFDSGVTLFYPTDLVPTSQHVPVAFHMGYDMCALTLLTEKEAFLRRASDEDALVIFQHDTITAAAKISRDQKGNWTAAPHALH